MKYTGVVWMALFGVLGLAKSAEEPIAGQWQMIYQRVGDMKAMPKQVPALNIIQHGSSLTFQYMVGLEKRVYRSFTVKLDGSPGEVMNEKGEAVGSATLKKNGQKYTLTLQSPNRPPEPGTLILSHEGKLLTMESDAILPDRGPSPTHVIQQYARPGADPVF